MDENINLKEKIYTIYCHTNKINGKKYVGQTMKKPESRWGPDGHGYIKDHTKFANAIQKYGWDNFDHEILTTCKTLEEADQLERFYIEKFDSVKNGYNLTSGGNSKKFISEESKQKMSDARKKYFKEHPEAKEATVKQLIESHPTEPTQRMLDSYKRSSITRRGSGNPMYGKPAWNKGIPRAEEEIKHMSESALKGADNPLSKAVIGTNIKTGEEISFGEICEAARSVGLKNETTIVACLKGRAKTSAGYTWRYKN